MATFFACFQTLPVGLQNALIQFGMDDVFSLSSLVPAGGDASLPFAELVSQGAEPGALRAWVQVLKVARQDSDRITSAMAAVPPEQRVVSLTQWEREGKVQQPQGLPDHRA